MVYRILLLLITFSVFGFGQEKIFIAILDFQPKGLSTIEAEILSEKLRQEVVASNFFEVVDRGNMDSILKEQEFSLSGCTSNECVVEIGQLLGVEKIMAGTVGKFGNLFTISLSLTNIETGKLEKNAGYEVSGNIENMLTFGIKNAFYKLMEYNTNSNEKIIVSDLPIIQNLSKKKDKKGIAFGFDPVVVIGRVKYENGGVKSVLGLSPGIGIGYKKYFTVLKENSFALQWNIGTDILILPFLGAGIDYRFKLGYVGLSISSRLITLFLPLPTIEAGFYF